MCTRRRNQAYSSYLILFIICWCNYFWMYTNLTLALCVSIKSHFEFNLQTQIDKVQNILFTDWLIPNGSTKFSYLLTLHHIHWIVDVARDISIIFQVSNQKILGMVYKGLSSPPIKCEVPHIRFSPLPKFLNISPLKGCCFNWHCFLNWFGSHKILPVILKCLESEQY